VALTCCLVWWRRACRVWRTGLKNLTTVTTTLTIKNITQLVSANLPALRQVGALVVQSNANLLSLQGLHLLTKTTLGGVTIAVSAWSACVPRRVTDHWFGVCLSAEQRRAAQRVAARAELDRGRHDGPLCDGQPAADAGVAGQLHLDGRTAQHPGTEIADRALEPALLGCAALS
jgi:hypothetical protein